jgi:ribosomal protein L37E
MNKLVEITKAWIIAANPSPEEKRKALYRSQKCDDCPSKSYNNHLKFEYCNECGCPLSKKIYSPVNSCPLNKWKI